MESFKNKARRLALKRSFFLHVILIPIATMAAPSPITLHPSPTREVVDDEKAQAMISSWTEQLLAHREANPTLSTLCDQIVLTNKSYTSSAATIIADFLVSEETFSPSIASGIRIAKLDDIIASRSEDEGLEVLRTISSAFQNSRLVEVDLSDNALGLKGLTACEVLLLKMKDSLHRLSFCNNGFKIGRAHV